MASTSSPNTLGLDFDQLKLEDPPTQEEPRDAIPSPESSKEGLTPVETREKKKPYVNLERVKTGGNQRDKLSEEALTERMARMREQNEKIKQRRMDVKADEEAFKKTQESERIKLAQIRKVQENVDRTREQNAKRKMDKIQSREWDSGKPAGEWKRQVKPAQAESSTSLDTKEKNDASVSSAVLPPKESGGWTRGGGPRGSSQRGRGRGRGSGARQVGAEQANEGVARAEPKSSPSTAPEVVSPEKAQETTS